ncbi:MAG: hypothetical protein ABIR24_03305 [Verrucomicrobiota bacterium]
MKSPCLSFSIREAQRRLPQLCRDGQSCAITQRSKTLGFFLSLSDYKSLSKNLGQRDVPTIFEEYGVTPEDVERSYQKSRAETKRLKKVGKLNEWKPPITTFGDLEKLLTSPRRPKGKLVKKGKLLVYTGEIPAVDIVEAVNRSRQQKEVAADVAFLESNHESTPGGPTASEVAEILKIQKKVRKTIRARRS